jgi:hypothetical protein
MESGSTLISGRQSDTELSAAQQEGRYVACKTSPRRSSSDSLARDAAADQ